MKQEKLNFKIQKVQTYNRHGCNFTGNLILVEYFDEMKRDPRYGQFASMVSHNYAEAAEKFVRETYPDCVRILSIPDFVAIIKEEPRQDSTNLA